MKNNDMLRKIFFKLLPIQVMIIAMGSINSIVDGVIAGRFIDAATVGVVGLFYSMINILNAITNTLLGGTSVLCGKAMGVGDIKETNDIFTVNIVTDFLLGLLITIICLLFSPALATLLGANEALKPALVLYIRGFAIGIIPMLLSAQIASFLQLERQNFRSYLGVIAMMVSNIAADIVFVSVLKMGVFGLALATTVSNFIYFIILGQFYLTGKSSFKLNIKEIVWSILPKIVKIGVPGAMLVFCLAIRGLVINRLLLKYGGSDGLSAMSAFNMISGLLIAYCIGTGSVVRMLVAIFIGEENKDAIKSIIKIVFTSGLLLTVGIAVIVVLGSGFIASIFFDAGSNVHTLTKQLAIIFGCSIPLVLVCCVNTNYLQAFGHNLMVNIISIFDGFLSMVIPSLILAPIIGVLGIWLANPIGIVMTALLTPIYCVIYWKHIPKNIDELLFVPKNFGAKDEDRLSVVISDITDVSKVAISVQEFCKNHKLSEKTSYYAALSLEEMAGNVVEHGFTKDNKKHTIEAQIVYKANDILLRIKDDCVPFNPEERAKVFNPEDPMKNIGIRMIYKLADSRMYEEKKKYYEKTGKHKRI